MEKINEIPLRIPKKELTDWAKKSIDSYLDWPKQNLEREFSYWSDLTPSDVELFPEKFHHTSIYAMCIFLNKLPYGLRMSSDSGRNQTSLNSDERKWLEEYFYKNKEKILTPIEKYVYSNRTAID